MNEKNNHPVLSLIIPIYNTPQELLLQCLKSVKENIVETDDIEVLLINDGSTVPYVEKIAKSLSATDNRITYIYKSNSGLSATRNVGMELACGEYVMFLDSDDYLEKDALSYLLKKIRETNADLLAMGYHSSNDEKIFRNYQEMLTGGRKNEFVLDIIEKAPQSRFCTTRISCVFAWGKAYKLNIIRENHLHFDTNIGPREDVDFNLQYLKYVDRLYLDNRVICHYIENHQSITRSFSDNRRASLSSFLKKLESLANDYQIQGVVRERAICYRAISEIRYTRRQYFTHPQNKKPFRELKAEMDAFLSEPTIRKWIDKFRLSDARNRLELKNVILLKLRLYWIFLITERRKRRRVGFFF